MVTKQWWKEAIVYQIYPRSFNDSNGDGIGDLNGIGERLDYLQNLGVDVIWLGPVYESPNEDNGYDISDYENIMKEFGTMADFERLLQEVHARSMKLIMDLVLNHTSDEHPWFVESRSSLDNPKRDWYIWSDGKNGAEPNNWESIFGGSAWEFDEQTKQYYMHLFAKKQPDLNWENKEMRSELYNIVNRWIDRGIDGFRIDAISHIKKKAGFPDMPNPAQAPYVECYDYMMNHEGIDAFLREFSDTALKGHDIMTVGEANGVTVDDVDRWVNEENGYFNMIFQFEHLELWNKQESADIDAQALIRILTKWQNNLENVGWNALFIENHDLTRSVSTLGNDTDYWKASAKMLGAMYFFMKGTPFIYQGQEIGMTNAGYPDIEDYNDVGTLKYYQIEREKGVPHDQIMAIIKRTCRDNSRSPMQWDSSPFSGFTSGSQSWIDMNPNYRHINVAEQERDRHSILSFYKKMIQLRKQHEVLVYGKYRLMEATDEGLIIYTRTLNHIEARIICNFNEQETWVMDLPDEKNLVLHNYEDMQRGSLRPYEARMYILKQEGDKTA